MATALEDVAFEKACVLYNIAALHSQLGARHDLTTDTGMKGALDAFKAATGVLTMLRSLIQNNYKTFPSPDLDPDVIKALRDLMKAQALEIVFTKAVNSACVVRSEGDWSSSCCRQSPGRSHFEDCAANC